MLKSTRSVPAADAETDLIACVARKDRAAFERLYRLYYRRVWRFLSRMLARPHDVEEALNETMLVVWSRASTFDHTSKLSTWVLGIAYRKALHSLRDTRPGGEPMTDDLIASAGDHTEQIVYQERLQTRIARAMLSLSAEQRAVIELTYYGGYSYPEIAEIMTCPTGTVKTRMMHARRKLKICLGAEWNTP